ncbi:MAG: hypothetical protein NXI16_01170 [Alphaproteobacteria bacterium]|nr:hypothetical protein [Alphaproteobacteria bacterium]
MKRIIAVLAIAGALSGCAAVGVAGGIVTTGIAAYCAGTSDAAKEAARDLFTAGQKIIACESD